MDAPVDQVLGEALSAAADAEPAAERRPLRRDLCSSIGDATSFSVMVGIGESYLPAFVLAMGLGEVASGLVTTVPLLAGSLLQLVSPAAVRRLGSHRTWVLICAAAQAVSFLPLAIAALAGSISTWAVFAVAAVYWGSGLGTGPAWNTWIGSIVPRRLRARFFARRTRLSQLGVLVGFLAGGVGLQIGAHRGVLLTMFAALFFVAAACRFTSAAFLSCQSEPERPSEEHRHVSLAEFFGRIRRRSDGQLLLYLLAVQTAAQIAGPYFTPFMLGPMELSYASYMTLMATSFAMKILALPAFGALAHRYGTRRLLWIGGVSIVPVAGLWVISRDFYYILGVQMIAGLSWAAYELAMFLLFFETIDAEERTSVLTSFNFANALATVLGSFIGGGLLAWFGKHQDVYLTLFGLSSLGRLSALVLLARLPAFDLLAEPLSVRTLGVRSGAGSLDQPILSSLKDASPAHSAPHPRAAGAKPPRKSDH